MSVRERTLAARLERFRRRTADLKPAIVLGAYGVGYHVVREEGSDLERIVPSMQGRETWAPGAKVTIATHAGKSGPAIIGKAPAGQQGGSGFALRRYPAGPAPTVQPEVDFLGFKWIGSPSWDRMAVARWREGVWIDSPDWYVPGDMDSTWGRLAPHADGIVFLRSAPGIPNAVAGVRGLLGGTRVYVVDPGAGLQYAYMVNPLTFLAWDDPGPWVDIVGEPLWDGANLYWLEVEQQFDGPDASEFVVTRQLTSATYRLRSSGPTLLSPGTPASFVRSTYPTAPAGKYLNFLETSARAAGWLASGSFHAVIDETVRFTSSGGAYEDVPNRVYVRIALDGFSSSFADSASTYAVRVTGDLVSNASLVYASSSGERGVPLRRAEASDAVPSALWPGSGPLAVQPGGGHLEGVASVGLVGSFAAAYLLRYDPESEDGGTTARLVTGTLGAPAVSTPVLANPAWSAAAYAGGYPDLMFPVARSA